MTTEQLSEQLVQWFTDAYVSLLAEYGMWSFAMLLFYVALPLSLVRFLSLAEKRGKRRKKAYLFRDTSKRVLHYVFLFAMPCVACGGLFSYAAQSTPGGRAFGVGLLLVALLAAILLLRWKPSGILMAGLFWLGEAAFWNYACLWAVLSDQGLKKDYSAAGQYAVYTLYDYLLTKGMAISLAVVVLMAVMAVYYYFRRFLFAEWKLERFPGCEYCGKKIMKRDCFCTACGKELRFNPISDPVEEMLDTEQYCKICGANIRGKICIRCAGSEWAQKTAEKTLKEKRQSIVRGVLLTVVLLVLLILPAVGGSVKKLQTGSAAVHNAFVEEWESFLEDPAVMQEDYRLDGFHAKLNALYAIDSRWYYVKPRSVSGPWLPYYAAYAEAAFGQMEVLEEMGALADAAAAGEEITEEELRALTDRMNQTTDDMMASLSWYGVNVRENQVLYLSYALLDGLRYFSGFFNGRVVSVGALTAAVLLLWGLLCGFSRRIAGWEPFVILAKRLDAFLKGLWGFVVATAKALFAVMSVFSFGTCRRGVAWVRQGLWGGARAGRAKRNSGAEGRSKERYAAYRRERRIISVITILTVLVIFGVFRLLSGRTDKGSEADPKQEFLQMCTEAASDYTVEVSRVLTKLSVDHTLTEEERERLYELMDAQLAADDAVLTCSLPKELADDEEYQRLLAGMQSLCRDDRQQLSNIRAELEENRVPSDQLIKTYAALRGEGYQWVLKELTAELVGFAVEESL